MRHLRGMVPKRLVTGLAVLLLVLSCGSEDNPLEPTPPDPTGAQQRVRDANAALENELFRVLQDDFDPGRPNDVDFRLPNRLYHEALGLDPGNLDAHFGVAVTDLLILSNDSEVNAAFDEWKQYLDAHTPFEVPNKMGQPLGVPLGFGAGAQAIRLPFDLVPMSLLATGRAAFLQADPQIGRVQNILRERVLPRVASANAHMGPVVAETRYTYTVTPRMQGDALEDPREIDVTDIYALRAGCALLDAACRIAVSYNLGLAAYDSTQLHNAMQPGSNWLRLVPDGAAQMGMARTEILQAVDHLDLAIASLENETDNQDDDVIKIGPDELSQRDLDSLKANLPNVRKGFTTGYTRVDDWDDDSFTPDVALTINVGNLLSDPVQDWKSLLPGYAATLERRGEGYGSYFYDSGSQQAGVNLGTSPPGYYYSYYSVGISDGERNESYSGPEFLRDPLMQVLEPHLPANTGSCTVQSAYGSATFGGYLSAGANTITVNWNTGYSLSETCVLVPVITWNADRFADWIWPDPTLGGLLPQIGSTTELFTVFGITADQWEKRWVLDWTDEF